MESKYFGSHSTCTSSAMSVLPARDLLRFSALQTVLDSKGNKFMQCLSAMPASQLINYQETGAQVAALKAAGGRWDRPELRRLRVWKLDRLALSLRDVLIITERLGKAGAGFRSLTEAIDTATQAGRMMMQMVGAFAEFERAMPRGRTKAGLGAAWRDGRIGRRLPKLSPPQQAEIREMVPRVTKWPLTPPGSSRFTRPPSAGSLRGRRARHHGSHTLKAVPESHARHGG